MRISDWSSDVCSSDLRQHLKESWIRHSAPFCLLHTYFLAPSSSSRLLRLPPALRAGPPPGSAPSPGPPGGRWHLPSANAALRASAAIWRPPLVRAAPRVEERRVGKTCYSTCKSGGSHDHYKQ